MQKKLLSVLGILLLAGSLSACGGSDNETPEASAVREVCIQLDECGELEPISVKTCVSAEKDYLGTLPQSGIDEYVRVVNQCSYESSNCDDFLSCVNYY